MIPPHLIQLFSETELDELHQITQANQTSEAGPKIGTDEKKARVTTGFSLRDSLFGEVLLEEPPNNPINPQRPLEEVTK